MCGPVMVVCLVAVCFIYKAGRKPFSVIDDIWDISAWNIIKCVFSKNDLASRVVESKTWL